MRNAQNSIENMAKLLVNNPFSSVQEIAREYRIVLPKPHEWKLMPKGVSGEISGLHRIRGVAMATNGIHVAILTNDDVLIGHLHWFVADEQPQEERVKTDRVERKPRVNIFEGFCLE